MKNLQACYEECVKELSTIGITCGNILKVIPNTRSKNRWGLCKHEPNGHIIEISYRLLQDEVSEYALKNTLIHELLHTVEGTCGHKGLWKELANKVNKYYPQYNIKRTTSEEEKGIEPVTKKQEAKYIISCPKCGWEEPYFRYTKVVEHTDRYRCTKCKNALVRVK